MEIRSKRTVIYARVSTTDQNVNSQLNSLRQYAVHREFELVGEYIDKGVSGKREKRPGLDKVMDLCRKKKVDIVLVFRFDRFARSLKFLLQALEEFQNLGIDFISYSENIDTGSPLGRVLYSLIGAFAAFEREILVERVKAGLEAAKKSGKILGRPKTICNEKIRALRQQGDTYKKIQKELKISKGAVYRALKSNP